MAARQAEHDRVIERLEPGQGEPGLFSVVVPVLNGAAHLQRCIDSVSAQVGASWELIVVDGGSTDGTLGIIERNRDAIVRWVSAKDNGIYAAFNRGVRLSRGEWIQFLGSDDVLWAPDVLARVAQRLMADTAGPRVAYGQVAVLDDERNLVELRGELWSAYRQRPVGRWTFEHQGIFHHRELFETHGLFDETFRICGDHELLLRELKAAEALYLEDIIVAGFGLGGASSLPRNLRGMIDEKRRALRLNGLAPQPVASTSVMVKMRGFEALRFAVGDKLAEGISRVYVRRTRAPKGPPRAGG